MKIAYRLIGLILCLALLTLACNLPGYAARLPTPSGLTVTSPPAEASTPDASLLPPGSLLPPLSTTPLLTEPPAKASTPRPTQAYRPTYQPVFQPDACAFPLPSGTDPECGYLIVPENRSIPGSPILRLHLAIFRSRSAQPDPHPVVHLAGGPGSSSLDVAGYLFQQGIGQVLESHDLILFDQRGAGYSQPRLDCPEREQITATLLANEFSPEEEGSLVLEALQSCRERLVGKGIDLAAYNSAASADDVNDLRLALGYPALNLYGVSYGTRLALTVLRDHPEAVHSVLLDSAYPLQVNLYTALAPNAERAFRAFFDACAAAPACSGRYPDLEAEFYALVDQLNASPIPVNLFLAGVGDQTVLLDGGLLVDVLFVGLYNPPVTAAMPRMIYDIRRGDYDILRERLGLYFDTSSALGMQMSVQCSEELPFSDPQEAYTAAQGVRPQIAAFFPDSVQALFAACRDWSSLPPDPRENQPVSSSLPALVLAGELDPITPPAWGRLVAGDLSNAPFYEFPGNGHWVTRSSDCALSLALAFWDDPAAPLDASCIQAEEGLDWR